MRATISFLLVSLSCLVLLCSIATASADASFQEDIWVTMIRSTLETLRKDPKTIKILQQWIQQPSLAGNEASQQELIAQELRKLDFNTVDVFQVENIEQLKSENKYVQTPRTSLKDSPIVIGILNGAAYQKQQQNKNGGQINAELNTHENQQQPGTLAAAATAAIGRNIILNGHIDVVPVGDLTQWKQNPWSGAYDAKTDRIHGRGSTDMKGGIFSSLLALMALKKMNVKLVGDVIFQSVIEEESGGAGTMASILRMQETYEKQRGQTIDGALIPEPTNLKLFPKQQGSTWFRVTIKGVAAHGGTRYEGVSAIEKAKTIVKALAFLERRRNKRVLDNDRMYQSFIARGIDNPVPINIGVINGGKWPSSVADQVTLEGRLGVIPDGETIEQAREELVNFLTSELSINATHIGINDNDAQYFAKNPVAVEFFGGSWVAGSVPLMDNINLLLARSYKLYTNEEPIIEASPWGTDAGYLTAHGIPAIVFGPGDTHLAHQTDESISVAQIYKCAGVIARMLLEYCGVASTSPDSH